MKILLLVLLSLFLIGTGCRIETAGDPNRPIKIEAHITIDIRQMKEAAADIEDSVAKPKAKKNSSFLSMTQAMAYAQVPQLQYKTPEVDAAIESRQARYETLQQYKSQGLVGEDNKGYVAARGGGAEVEELVAAENADRDVIYNAIIEQNNLTSADIANLHSAFAEVRRDKAEPGEWIQLPDGEWAQK